MDTSTWKKSRYTSPDARSAVTLIAELTTPELFCAHLCAKAGVPLEVVSNRLGHASILATVAPYLHVYSDRNAEAASAFDRLVG
jgi:hypothetical protein